MIFKYPKNIISDIGRLRSRAHLTGCKKALAEILQPDAPGSWQISKYLVIGMASVLVFYTSYGIFRMLSEFFLRGSFSNHRLTMNLMGIFAAFIPTNWFTYATNRRWVFQDGRHDSQKEFFLFTLVAACSFVASQFFVAALIISSPLDDFFIVLLVIVLSTAINYVFRKYVVFQG